MLALHGELDLASRGLLEGELLRARSTGGTRLVVDMSQLEFIDGAGLHTLLDAHERCCSLGQEFSLIRGPRAVQRLLELTGSDEIFRFEPLAETAGITQPNQDDYEASRLRAVSIPTLAGSMDPAGRSVTVT